MKKWGNIRVNHNEVGGLIWNYISLFVLSVSGFIFNIIILAFYDATALGIFNQAFAWYVVFSQIAVFGIQISMTYYAAEYRKNRKELLLSFGNAVMEVALISVLVSVGLQLALSQIVGQREELLYSVKIIVWALPFFSINKVILGYLNGLSEMKAYGIFQAMRYILIAITLSAMAFYRVDRMKLSGCFIIAEAILVFLLMIYIKKKELLQIEFSKTWLKKHLIYGIKIIPSNFVLELNMRVDVICLSFILQDDYLIGVYSFAILFADGFYQFYVVLRRIINPKLTEKYYEGILEQYWGDVKKKMKRVFPIASVLIYILLLTVYVGLCLFLGKTEYLNGIFIFVIVGFSIVLNAKFIVLGNLFSQVGNPLRESWINVISVMSNVILNCILIWEFGLIGAAVATGISHFVFAAMLNGYAKREMVLNI